MTTSTRDPLPRAVRSFGPIGTVLRGKRFGRINPAAWLGRVTSPIADDMTIETITLVSQQYGLHKRVGDVTIPASLAVELLGSKASFVVEDLLEEIGRALRREGHVVEPDVRPKVRWKVTVEASMRVPAWPAEPGLTTAPYRPIGAVPVGQPLGELLRDVHRLADVVHRDGWRAVLLAHPGTLPGVKARGIGEYWSLVEDETAPAGMVVVAEEIG